VTNLCPVFLDLFDNKDNHCEEHYWPRLWAGVQIVKTQLRGELSFYKLVNLLEKFTHIHRVTKEENRILERFQQCKSFISPEHAYESAGIQLVRVKEYQPNPLYSLVLDRSDKNCNHLFHNHK